MARAPSSTGNLGGACVPPMRRRARIEGAGVDEQPHQRVDEIDYPFFPSKIAGTPADDSPRWLKKLGPGDELFPQAEPYNEHDPNAVRLLDDEGHTVGYATAAAAEAVALRLDHPESGGHIRFIVNTKPREGSADLIVFRYPGKMAEEFETTIDSLRESLRTHGPVDLVPDREGGYHLDWPEDKIQPVALPQPVGADRDALLTLMMAETGQPVVVLAMRR
jgi:hypothetical protein